MSATFQALSPGVSTSTPVKVAVDVWFNDEDTPCKAGSKTAVYETFKRMLARSGAERHRRITARGERLTLCLPGRAVVRRRYDVPHIPPMAVVAVSGKGYWYGP